MARLFTLFVIISLFFPVNLLAQWRLDHGEDPITGGNIYVAQLDKVKLQNEGKRTKARMSLIFSCSSQWPDYYWAMFLDTAPVFSVPEDKTLPMKSIAVLIVLQNAGYDKRNTILTTVSQWRKKPKELLFDSSFTKKIHNSLSSSYDYLSIGFLPTWDGEVVIAKVPLKGAVAAINKATYKCNSEMLEKINKDQDEMQKDLGKIEKGLQKIIKDLESKE